MKTSKSSLISYLEPNVNHRWLCEILIQFGRQTVWINLIAYLENTLRFQLPYRVLGLLAGRMLTINGRLSYSRHHIPLFNPQPWLCSQTSMSNLRIVNSVVFISSNPNMLTSKSAWQERFSILQLQDYSSLESAVSVYSISQELTSVQGNSEAPWQMDESRRVYRSRISYRQAIFREWRTQDLANFQHNDLRPSDILQPMSNQYKYPSELARWRGIPWEGQEYFL
jgi:hypothetical protein